MALKLFNSYYNSLLLGRFYRASSGRVFKIQRQFWFQGTGPLLYSEDGKVFYYGIVRGSTIGYTDGWLPLIRVSEITFIEPRTGVRGAVRGITPRSLHFRGELYRHCRKPRGMKLTPAPSQEEHDHYWNTP
jgi:hypothetical protein